MEATAAVEEYLEAIYRLQEKVGRARTSDIVKILKVAPGTVTNTIERLEADGYVIHEPYKGVKLTERGLKVALHVVRKHRLSERLLTDVLHVGWDKAHEAACRLEHGMSSEVVEQLDMALKHPKTCPHGNPIPTERGEVPKVDSSPLTELNEQERCVVVRITDEDPRLLRYLMAINVVPGATLEVVEKAPFDGPITVKVRGTHKALSIAVASVIEVRREDV